MTGYTCPTCGQPAPEPAWRKSRAAGFDPDTHCRVIANYDGRVVPCVGPAGLCDLCPIGISYGAKPNSGSKKKEKKKFRKKSVCKRKEQP